MGKETRNLNEVWKEEDMKIGKIDFFFSRYQEAEGKTKTFLFLFTSKVGRIYYGW